MPVFKHRNALPQTTSFSPQSEMKVLWDKHISLPPDAQVSEFESNRNPLLSFSGLSSGVRSCDEVAGIFNNKRKI